MPLLGLLSISQAATLVQTKTLPLHTPNANFALVFDQFDSSLGTLDSVQFVFVLSMYGGSVSVDNDSEVATSATATVRLDGLLTSSVSIPGLWISNTLSQVFELGPTSGDPIDQYNNTGDVDHATLYGASSASPKTETASGSVAPGSLSDYVGTGTYTINAATLVASGASGAGVQYAVTVMQTFGELEVTYTYTPIPEPATAGLAGLGALLLLRRRRR